MEQQFKYLVEEFHRGDWNPLFGKTKDGSKKQRRVFITEEQAESMNKYSEEYKQRYVLASETKPIEEIEVIAEEVLPETKSELQAIYQEKFGKKPFHGWDEEQLKEKLNA